MTDGQPEPFRMSTGDGDPEDVDESVDDQPDDQPDEDGGSESIADLIDEASRTAAEQAVQAATGTAPPDRSSEVWGGPVDEEDLDAVWSAAAERHSGRHVFDSFHGDEDKAWASATGRMPSAAADPGRGPDGRAEDEPDVFMFAVDEPDDEQGDASSAGGTTDEDDAGPVETPAAGVRPDDTDAIWGGRAADAGASAGTTDDPDAETWAAATEQDDTGAVWDDAAGVDEEPDPFRFAAGAATSAPAAVPDHVTDDDEPEPDTFAFAVDAATDEPPQQQAPAGSEGPQPEPTTGDDPADDGSEDGIWRGSAVFDDEADDPDADSDAGGPVEAPPLAESATPRADTGWQDLDEEQASWSLPDTPRTSAGGDDEPDGFVVSLDAPEGASGDESDAGPTASDPDGGTTSSGDELQGALEELVDDTDATEPDRAPDPALGHLDDLDDALAGLDEYDDLGSSTVDDRPAGAPRPGADTTVPERLDEAAPTTDAAPAAGPPLSDMPPPAAAPSDTAGADDEDEDDDAPSPATPPGLTFSSSSRPKKRGLFGR